MQSAYKAFRTFETVFMTEPAPKGLSLTDVRRTIDAIDDQMLELLEQRFAMIEHVRALKLATPGSETSPLRPAREAQVLRRILAKARIAPPDLLVRLWPAIFSAASLKQVKISIHASAAADETQRRLMIHDYFPLIPVDVHADAGAAIAAIQMRPSDIAIVAVDDPWADVVKSSKISVIAALPVLSGQPQPQLLVLGQLAAEPTGKDETIISCNGGLPRDFPVKPNWQGTSGVQQIVGLPGFLSEKEAPLLGIIRSNARLGIKVLGRYPAVMRSAP